MKPCESCPCPDYPCHASSSPDLLNDLHTLRSLAHLLKAQADGMRLLSHSLKAQAEGMRLWTIAAHCAAVSETCTLAIDHFNAVHPANAKANG